MLLRAILIAIIVYYAIKAVRALIAAMRSNSSASSALGAPPPFQEPYRRPADSPVARRPVEREVREVEDAKWEDLT